MSSNASNQPARLALQAPAKVNYRLDVLRRRDDGYHELLMIMQPVDLCDDIVITLTDPPAVRVSCGAEGVPDGEGNIAWKAARTMLALAPRPVGVDISITKRIPVAAGLGGGSSNAAAVLMGLNRLLGLELPPQRLMELGVKLGADVPFFILGGPALAEGIGELLTPLQTPPAWLVLVNPRIAVSTAWVYGNLQLTKKDPLPRMTAFPQGVRDLCAILSNDLETVTIPRFPVVGRIKERLLQEGACGAMMSGSGPTVFGVFDDGERAAGAAAVMAAEGWFSVAVQTLHGH